MKNILQNLKTTFFGSIAGLPVICEGIKNHDVMHILAGVGALLLGLFAKDSNTSN